MSTSPVADEAVFRQPLEILPTRVFRFYQGGLLIDQLRQAPIPLDNEFPEDWVGSVTQAINKGREGIVEGLSTVRAASGDTFVLKDLVAQNPAAMVGAEQVARYGNTTALLVKLLDSRARLPIHCHPTREFARAHFNSPFGKTEAWIIIGTREIDGVPPYILLGFQEGVTRAQFERWVETQDSAAMIAAMHRLDVYPGDVYYVEAGLPHAIGEGVFMIEAQEPSDFSVLAEYTPFHVAESAARMGLSWPKALSCFDITGYSRTDLLARFQTVRHDDLPPASGRRTLLDTPFFGSSSLAVPGGTTAAADTDGRFAIDIVLAGSGKIGGGFGSVSVNKGSALALPANLGSVTYSADTGADIHVIRCTPPPA